MKPDELLEYAAKDPATWSKDEIRRLLREAATAITKQQQDAERYRWLREGLSVTDIRAIAYEREIDPGRGETAYNIEVDRAIDAAMKGANK